MEADIFITNDLLVAGVRHEYTDILPGAQCGTAFKPRLQDQQNSQLGAAYGDFSPGTSATIPLCSGSGPSLIYEKAPIIS